MSESQYHPPTPPQGQYPPPGQYPPVLPSSGKATTSLILGICSLVACGFFLGIPAMIIGRQAKKEIEASQGRLGGEGLATAGFITGLIGTIWSVLATLALVGLIVFGGALATDFAESCTTVTDDSGNTTIECE